MNITEEIMNDVFTKYHINGLPVNAVLHHFTAVDINDHLHDHPFNFTSFIVSGSYIERVYKIDNVSGKVWSRKEYHRKKGESHKVYASTIHEIIDLPDGECWTLILPEMKVKEPSFYKVEGYNIWIRQWNEKEFREL